MFKKANVEKKVQPKGSGYAMMAPVLTMLSAMELLEAEPVSRLFGLILFAGMIAFIAAYLWHEIKRVYPDDKIKRKRIYSILSALTGIAFVPLMVILLTAQFVSLYKNNEKISSAPGFWKKDDLQFYIIAVLCIWIGSGFYLYYAYFLLEWPW